VSGGFFSRARLMTGKSCTHAERLNATKSEVHAPDEQPDPSVGTESHSQLCHKPTSRLHPTAATRSP
jgi:hypothetical protein